MGSQGFAVQPAVSQLGEEPPPGGSAEPPCALEETWENVGDPQTSFFSPFLGSELLSSSPTLPSLDSGLNNRRLIGCNGEFR